MTPPAPPARDQLAQDVRLHVFREAAETARVPQAPRIAAALGRAESEIQDALRELAAGKVLILAPNSVTIWAANPFCAVPMGFRVNAARKTYEAICVWDALGIAACLGTDAVVSTACGDCGEPMELEVRDGDVTQSEAVIHFAVPAHHWWDNIGFT